MLDSGYVLRQTSPEDLSIPEYPFYIYQTRDISCGSPKCIIAHNPTNKYHRTDLQQIPGQLESLPTCRDPQQDVSSVECAR
jgi:hypothetical protein